MKIPVAPAPNVFGDLPASNKTPALAPWLADDGVYTLYMTHAVLQGKRTHVATFDAVNDDKANCENVAGMFRERNKSIDSPAIYWCEPGRFHEEAAR